MTRIGVVLVVAVMGGGAQAAPAASKVQPPPAVVIPEDVPPPAPEAHPDDPGIVLPGIPSFDLPPPEGDFHTPRELRVKGTKLLDTDVKVKGYITWIYSCIDDVRLPKESRAKTQQRIDDDPTQCERPKFYLGDTKDGSPEHALWVVDVPRPPNKLEKQRLPKADLAAWPKVPSYKLGDYVVLSGKFTTTSPHSERNSDGLLVFAAIEPAKPPKTPPVVASSPTPLGPPPTLPERPKPPLLTPIEPAKRGESMKYLRDANGFYAKRQYADSEKAYRDAVAAWKQNHLAWYGLGGVLASQGKWAEASAAFDEAVGIHPDASMYLLWSGVARYELMVQRAKEDDARKRGVPPEQGTADLSSINFERAFERLDVATRLEPNLWRGQYYLGRILRAAGKAQLAAEAFTRAALHTKREEAPYVALGELYRKWDYTKEAIEVATMGTTVIPPTKRLAPLWYVLGMARDDGGDHAGAVDAFSQALILDPDYGAAMFQRGQALFKLGKWAEAKVDLEAFVNSASPTLEMARQQAKKFLDDIASKKK